MRLLFILIVLLTLPGMSLTAQSGLRTSWGNDNLRKESRINIDVFPNPATHFISLSDVTGVTKIVLYNMVGVRGKRVFRNNTGRQAFSGKLT